MSWQLSGRFHEFCNCDLLCPCVFDATAHPDQGWCGGAFTFDIHHGSSDGVNLDGRTAVIVLNIPGTFAEGNITARLYVDEGADTSQRQALEAIFTGQQGGPWEVVAPAFAEWLPTKSAPISVRWDDKPEIVIGDVGRLVSDLLVDPHGQPTQIMAAGALDTFKFTGSIQPSRTTGSHFADPDLRGFEGNSGYMGAFAWSV